MEEEYWDRSGCGEPEVKPTGQLVNFKFNIVSSCWVLDIDQHDVEIYGRFSKYKTIFLPLMIEMLSDIFGTTE